MFTLLALLAADPPPVPNPEQPYDYASWLNEQFAVPEKDNAAPRYLEAVEAFVFDDDIAGEAKEPLKWSPRNDAKARVWIKQNERALRLLHEAARIRKCYFAAKTGEPLSEAVRHYLSPLRSLTNCCLLQIRFALEDGDVDAALDHLETALRVSRHLREQPVIIDYLVGLAIARPVYDWIGVALQRKGLDAEAFARAVRRIDRTPPSHSRALRGDLAFSYDLFQRGGTGPDDRGRYTLEFEGRPLFDPLTPQTLHAGLSKAYAEVIDLRGKDYADVAALSANSSDFAKRHGLGATDSLSAVVRVEPLTRALETARAGMRAQLLLAVYHAEHDEWPETLEAARKGESAKRLRCAFSGHQLVYKKTADGPLLYSIWTDLKDGGGQVRTDRLDDPGDLVFLPTNN